MKKHYFLCLLLFLTFGKVLSQVTVTFTLSSGENSITIPQAGLSNVGFSVNLSKPTSMVTDGTVKIYAKGGPTSASPIDLGFIGVVTSGSWTGSQSTQSFLISGSFSIFPSSTNNEPGILYAQYEDTFGAVYKSANKSVAVPIYNNVITAPSVSSFVNSGNPALINGTNPSGGNGFAFTFRWQSSTISQTSGFSNITSATSRTYDPPTLTQTTYYRRVATAGTGPQTHVSNVVKIEVNNFPPILSNSITNSGNSTLYGASADPSILNGSTPSGGAGSYVFQWQSSITSASAGFSNITSATSQNFDPTSISQTTHYRRVVTSGGLTSNSNVITITLRPIGSTFEYPIDIGNLLGYYGDRRWAEGYGDDYGTNAEDIFYKFSISDPVTLSVYNCKSDGLPTIFYLLDNTGALIHNGTTIESCDVGIQVDYSLSAGIYYLVNEPQGWAMANIDIYVFPPNGSSSGRLSDQASLRNKQTTRPIELTKPSSGLVYPNPADYYLSIHSDGMEDFEIQIQDKDGITVVENTTINSSKNINVSSLSPGIYYVRVIQGQTIRWERLVIQH